MIVAMRIAIVCNHRLLLRAAALGAILSLGGSTAARAGIADGVKAETLPNGLRVLVLENHKAPVATFNVFYRVGARNEEMGKTGISHLCEHLMFRGTKKLKPEEFSNIIQQSGGEDNAFTEDDFTDYFEDINKNHLDVPISLEADRMANFEPKGFDSEKAVVLEERRMRTEDNPEDALDEVVRAQAFLAHPYHWPVIGWFNDVDGLTRADAMAYHAIYYSPRNAIVVVVGEFNADQVLKQIRDAFGSIKNSPKPSPPSPRSSRLQDGTRQVELHHAANLPAFEEAFHVPNLRDPDAFALEIASEILSDGKSSRLYKKLVTDKRMVVDVGAGYDMTSSIRSCSSCRRGCVRASRSRTLSPRPMETSPRCATIRSALKNCRKPRTSNKPILCSARTRCSARRSCSGSMRCWATTIWSISIWPESIGSRRRTCNAPRRNISSRTI